MCLLTGYKKFFDQKQLTNKISVSVQSSDVESFKFNGKNIRDFYIKYVGQCLISHTAVGYNKKNGVQTMQRIVQEKYKMRLGNAVVDMKEVGKNVHLHADMVLLQKPGLYCFLIRWKTDEAEPFMEWAVKTVSPQEVQKLALANEKKRCSTCTP